MKRLIKIVAIVALIPASFLNYRAVAHYQARRAALPIIADLGGSVGSISAPLGGTQYVVAFRGVTLTRAEIDRLVVLNDLADAWNSVGMFLDEADIAPEDRRYLKELLVDVHVYPGKLDPPSTPSH